MGSDAGKTLNKTWSFTTQQGLKSDNSQTPTPPAQQNASGEVGFKINGNLVDVNPKPMIVNGSTFIPLRGVFESIGATVSWDNDTRIATVVRGNTTIKVKIGSKYTYVNGNGLVLETAPFISDTGSTYVPLRFISETIGAKVGWEGDNWTAVIDTN